MNLQKKCTKHLSIPSNKGAGVFLAFDHYGPVTWANGPFYIGAYGNIQDFNGAFGKKDGPLQNFDGPKIS